jgi:hypothetical protein
MEAQQLSFEDHIARQALAARDVGMVEAEFAEIISASGYSDALEAAIRQVALTKCEVHIDDVLPLMKVKASNPNSAGAVWMRLQKDGTLGDEIGRRRCLTDIKKKAHKYPVYASGLFYGRRA